MKGVRYFTLFLLVVVVATLLSACEGTKEQVDLKYSRELTSLAIRSGVSGSFFLGSGSVNSDPVYIFAEKGEDGLVAVKIIPHTIGVYKEDVGNGETSYVEFYRCPNYCRYSLPQALQGSYSLQSFYVFHIPSGSVASVYDLGFTKP